MTATKNFLVDSFVAGLGMKAPCVAVATSNITLSGEQTVNGVAVVTDDRVLVTAQAFAVDNGIYDVSTGAWTRAGDFDGNRDVVKGTMVAVTTAGHAELYEVTSANPITIGTSALTFSQRYLLDKTATETVSGAWTYQQSGNTTLIIQKAAAVNIAMLGWNNEVGGVRFIAGLAGNTDDDFLVGRYNDAGTYEGAAIWIDGLTGQINLAWGVDEIKLSTQATGVGITGDLSTTEAVSVGTYIKNRTETSTNLLDIAHDVNINAGKIQGAQVYDITLNKPLWAAGNTDGAVWVDAQGTTIHTPS